MCQCITSDYDSMLPLVAHCMSQPLCVIKIKKHDMTKRIERIKNYNQIILAIAGTIGVVFLLFAAFFALEELSRSFLDSRADSNNQGILAIEETNELNKDSLRKQIISFNRMQVIDSINQIFLIPVTQANLAAAERDNEILGLMNTKSIGRSYEKFYGNIYNNLVLHDRLKNESQLIFDERISIENFIVHENSRGKFIVIPGCNIDSNKDGYLNENDLQELFIYNVQNRSLNKILSEENYTTLRVYKPDKSNELIAHFGIDRNKNGVFNSSSEPMIFYRINLEKMAKEEFVSQEQIEQLQLLLEGK